MANETTGAVQPPTTVANPTVSADALQSAEATATATPTPSDSTAATPDDLDIIARLTMDSTPTATSASVPVSTDEGTLTRIQQQSAKMRQALIRQGIDPDALDDNQQTPPFAPVQSRQQGPVDPKAKLDSLLGKVLKQNAVTPQDFTQFVLTLKESMDLQDRREMTQAESQNVQSCVSAIKSVLSSDPVYQKLPPNIQTIEDDLFVAATDYMLLNDAKSRGIADPRQVMNPQNYRAFAQRMTGNLKTLRQFYMSIGTRTPKPPTTETNVQPLTNASGFTPAMPKPASPFNANDIVGSIRSYEAGIRRL